MSKRKSSSTDERKKKKPRTYPSSSPVPGCVYVARDFRIVGTCGVAGEIGKGDYNLNMKSGSRMDTDFSQMSPEMKLSYVMAEVMQNVVDWTALESFRLTPGGATGLGTYFNGKECKQPGILAGALKFTRRAQMSASSGGSYCLFTVRERKNPDNTLLRIYIRDNRIDICQIGVGMLDTSVLLPVGNTTKHDERASGRRGVDMSVPEYGETFVPQAGGHGVGLKMLMLAVASERGWTLSITGSAPVGSCIAGRMCVLKPEMRDDTVIACGGLLTPIEKTHSMKLIPTGSRDKPVLIHTLIAPYPLADMVNAILYSHLMFRLNFTESSPLILRSDQLPTPDRALDEVAALEFDPLPQIPNSGLGYINGMPVLAGHGNGLASVSVVARDIRKYSSVTRSSGFWSRLGPRALLAATLIGYASRNRYLGGRHLEPCIRRAVAHPESRWATTLFGIGSATLKRIATDVLGIKNHFFSGQDVREMAAKMRRMRVPVPPVSQIKDPATMTPLFEWLFCKDGECVSQYSGHPLDSVWDDDDFSVDMSALQFKNLHEYVREHIFFNDSALVLLSDYAARAVKKKKRNADALQALAETTGNVTRFFRGHGMPLRTVAVETYMKFASIGHQKRRRGIQAGRDQRGTTPTSELMHVYVWKGMSSTDVALDCGDTPLLDPAFIPTSVDDDGRRVVARAFETGIVLFETELVKAIVPVDESKDSSDPHDPIFPLLQAVVKSASNRFASECAFHAAAFTQLRSLLEMHAMTQLVMRTGGVEAETKSEYFWEMLCTMLRPWTRADLSANQSVKTKKLAESLYRRYLGIHVAAREKTPTSAV